MWTIFKVFIEFVTILLLFYVFFWLRSMWDLSSQPGIELAPPALEGKVLTTGPPRKSLPYPFSSPEFWVLTAKLTPCQAFASLSN